MDSTKAFTLQREIFEKQKNKKGDTNKLSKSHGYSLEKNQCDFYLDTSHWKKDCPKLREKAKRFSTKAKTNFSMKECDKDSNVSLSAISQSLYLNGHTGFWMLVLPITFVLL